MHKRIQIIQSQRLDGYSSGGYAQNNLADYVGEASITVHANRAKLRRDLALAHDPIWLRQVHGTEVVYAPKVDHGTRADGIWTDWPEQPIAIQTADCLPVVIAARDGSCVGVAHAGWRGLLAGVIEATADEMAIDAGDVWFGPCIAATEFEVGPELRQAFMDQADYSAHFSKHGSKYFADLKGIAAQRLKSRGLRLSGTDPRGTLGDSSLYSHRGDRGTGGRMATICWLTLPPGAT